MEGLLAMNERVGVRGLGSSRRIVHRWATKCGAIRPRKRCYECMALVSASATEKQQCHRDTCKVAASQLLNRAVYVCGDGLSLLRQGHLV